MKNTAEESIHYGDLNIQQKSIIDDLKSIGYQHKSKYTWTHDEYGDIQMNQVSGLSDVLVAVYNKGYESFLDHMKKEYAK